MSKKSIQRQRSVSAPETAELMVKIRSHQKSLSIGVPHFNILQEKRVPITPEGARQLIARGHKVVIQSGAGSHARYSDNDYSEVGCQIAYSPEEVFKEANIIIQATPPIKEEVKWLKPSHILISPLQLHTFKRKLLESLLNKGVSALAMEYIQDRPGSYPFVRAMSQIAGTASVLIAGEYMSTTNAGSGILPGNIASVPPAHIVIIGAGVVGEYAARAAIGLGMEIHVFDYSVDRLSRLQSNLGFRVYTSTIYPDALRRSLRVADIAIGALAPRHGRTPIVVTEEMVSQMKPGAIIIDVSIDRGGCFETSEITTHDNPVFTKYDVIHYCVPNIPSRYARSASIALSNILIPMLLEMAEAGGLIEYMWNNPQVRNGVYIFKGLLTSVDLSERFKMRVSDLNLILPAYR